MKSQSLEQKLDVLMSLATDDREGLPARLRHTKEVGALRPLNIRNLRPAPGMRMSLLRILMTNACSYNCHYCPMRRDRPMPPPGRLPGFPWGLSKVGPESPWPLSARPPGG